MNDTFITNDIGLNHSSVVDHDTAICVPNTNLVARKSRKFDASSINDVLGSEDTSYDVSSKNARKSSLIQSGDSVGDSSKCGIGRAENGCGVKSQKRKEEKVRRLPVMCREFSVFV